MWREINGANSGNINNVAYQTAMLYPDEIKSDDDKVAFAKTQVVPIVKGQVPEAKGNQKILATEVSRLNIGEAGAGELVLRVMIGYKKDKNSNGNYQPTDYKRAFSDEAKTYRAAHPQE